MIYANKRSCNCLFLLFFETWSHDPPALASEVLGLNVCITIYSFFFFKFLRCYLNILNYAWLTPYIFFVIGGLLGTWRSGMRLAFVEADNGVITDSRPGGNKIKQCLKKVSLAQTRPEGGETAVRKRSCLQTQAWIRIRQRRSKLRHIWNT